MENENVPSAEELAAEQADLKIPTEDEVRAKVIEDFGFDETEDAERIDKLVKKDIEDRKRLSSTIKAKIKYREASKKPKDEQRPPVESKKPETQDISSRDAIVLTGAGVTNDEDIDEVVDYAKYKGISITEALKAPVIVASLAEKAEIRKTAEAQNIKGSRRSNVKPNDDQIIEKANAQEEVDASDLARARMNKRKEASSSKR